MSLFAEESIIDFSGFSRVVVGVIDDKNVSYQGYDDSLSFAQNSLLGIQLEAKLNEQFSVTTQLLAHSSDTRDSGVEWLYLTFQPVNGLRFKAGRMRTPFFSYSDVLDVGYAYHWANPPQQVYNAFLFDNYDGLNASYEIVASEFSFELEAYTGKFDDEISIGGTGKVAVETEDFYGLALIFKSGNLKARVSSHLGSANFDIPSLQSFANILRQANFQQSADSLTTTGDVKAEQISISYDELDYFLSSEYIRIRGDTLVVPRVDSYYFTAGYINYPFTYHATFANNSTSYKDIVNEIPSGVAPQVDALLYGYTAIYQGLPKDILKSLTLGVRWDFKVGMALKVDVSHLQGEPGERSFFRIDDPQSYDYKTNLVQVAWEWVF
ncbi:MAG: hypothetical protein ACI965_000178 [Paraglaciecola sp.]|jgi:hypothetical protein